MMTAAALLELFRLISHDQLYAHPRDATVAALVLQLPTEAGVYEKIADEAFEAYLMCRDEPDAESFQRIVDILIVLLYVDGRTFAACLRTAEGAYERPAYGIYGVNALAAVANFMRRGRPIPVDRADLRRKLKAFESNADLSHNAAECLRMLSLAYR